ncbi:hypothetical protein SLEP1_g14833 [Rubroshorea leprosula]|uniref:Uncharacterized protein n=1 Tax=Rubroshorea leprosula TaxID=152421 RepID=A0AAV5IPU4_9ROSI|nr:hypothetical protein SLEP1_g14833 [Rubroshorea leprosula]
MSLEQTLSIESGKGMQELSSSSSSEVETSRSGGSERVKGEIEEVGVLSNVLEVDDNRAKYYNEEEEYSIPGHVLLRLAEEMERACSALRDHWMPIYRHYLIVGPRFPVPELLVALLVEYRLGITQLVPNVVRSDAKLAEVCRWKRKKANHNQYSLSAREQDKVERLERRGGEVMDIMYLTSPEMRDEPTVVWRQDHCPPGEEVQGPRGRSRKGVPYSKVEIELLRKYKQDCCQALYQIHFPKVDLKKARHEVDEHEGSGVVRHMLEMVNLVNALVVEYYDCFKKRNNLVEKNQELNQQKQSAKQNFNDLTSELEKVREELTFAKAATKAEEAGVEEDGEKYEFIAVDEDEVEVPGNTEVRDNAAKQEVDQ